MHFNNIYIIYLTMKKSELQQIIKEEIQKSLNEIQQLQSLEQQAKDFVSKYGKVKIKL